MRGPIDRRVTGLSADFGGGAGRCAQKGGFGYTVRLGATPPRRTQTVIEALLSDDIVDKFGGRFKLTALIQKRLQELIEGARPLVDRHGRSDLEIVIAEIMEEKITLDWDASELTPPAKKKA
jgi:DNA-directed RNA polymerase subunit omega